MTVPASHSVWFEMLNQPNDNGLLRKLRWKVMRESMELSEAAMNLGLPSHQAEFSLKHTAVSSCGRSVKWKFGLVSHSSDSECETVFLLPHPKRATVCVSSQVGCAVGCVFCATGTMGLKRNLTTAQILEQVYRARCHANASGAHLRNIVFMGMGEPLHNFDAVTESIDWLVADKGFGFSPKHVTLSTVGVPSRMVEMAKRYPSVRIALSLHSCDSEIRKQLVPKAISDLAVLRQTIEELNRLQPEIPVWLEYVMIDGVNDTSQDSLRLVEFCKGLNVEVNVIPLNDSSHALLSSYKNSIEGRLPMLIASSPEKVQLFINSLRSHHVITKLRKSIGQSIHAACGQLVAPKTVSA